MVVAWAAATLVFALVFSSWSVQYYRRQRQQERQQQEQQPGGGSGSNRLKQQ